MGCFQSNEGGGAVERVPELGNALLASPWNTYAKQRDLSSGASCRVVLARSKKPAKKVKGEEKVVAASRRRRFAVKVMQRFDNNERLFVNETRILRRLDHPHVVKVVETYATADTLYVVGEFLEGKDLFERVAIVGRISERLASRLIRQVMEALAYCHTEGVVHRDIKPENLVFETAAVEYNSDIRVIDFGVAREFVDADAELADIAGSPYYVAPEVLDRKFRRSGATWMKSDVWSLGVVAYVLVHGYPPFNGATNKEIFHAVRTGKLKLRKKHGLSEACHDFLRKVLDRNVESRMSAADALKHPWLSPDEDTLSDRDLLPSVMESLRAFKQQCRLKKAVAHAMSKDLADAMTEDERKDLGELFRRFDKNGDGVLGADEVALLMKELGDKSGAAALMKFADADGDGVIDEKEFEVVGGLGKLSESDMVGKAFDKFDKDGDKQVDMEEIIMQMKGMSEEDARRLIAEVDTNGDGKISFEEWVSAMHVINSK